MYKNNKPIQIQILEKTLQKVKSGKGKFISHESVTQWLESWGKDCELQPSNNYSNKLLYQINMLFMPSL